MAKKKKLTIKSKLPKSGIYVITCILDSKVYVGRSKNWKNRINAHKRKLVKNMHFNSYLQNAYNKYGESNFTFELLEEYEEEFFCSMENYWCNMLNSHNREFGYNIEPTSPDGYKTHSQETKNKIRSKRIKNLENEEFRNMGREATIKALKNRIKRVMKYSFNGDLLETYKNIIEAIEKTGFTRSNIASALSGNLKSYGGFVWIKESELEELHEKLKAANLTNKKGVKGFTKDLVKINEWRSIREAAKLSKISREKIKYSCSNGSLINGIIFKYSNNEI